MNTPTKRQLAYWYRRAKLLDEKSTDGYSLGKFNDYGWTFQGGADQGSSPRFRPCRSLDDIGEALPEMQVHLGAAPDGDPIRVHDGEDAQFWRIVGNKANNLPLNYKHRALLVEVAELGALGGAVIRHGLTKRQGEWVWRKFLVEVCELPAPKTTVPGRKRVHNEDPPEPAAPVRTLSKAERKKLACVPPKSIPDTQADLDHKRKPKKAAR